MTQFERGLQHLQTVTNDTAIQAWSTYPPSLIEEFGDEGDAARRYLLNPSLYAALGDVTGQRVLDAGCGTGYLCRALARRGAQMTGVEPATNFFAYAIERERNEPLGITYLQQDLSLFKPEPETFDVVIANMVFMDIPDYQPAMHHCIKALRTGGQFIFSLLHPCFDEIDSPNFAKGYSAKGYIRIDEYLQEFVVQQRFGYYIHRPLSAYLNFVIAEGCTIRKIFEPTLTAEGIAVLSNQDRNLHIPNFMIVSGRKE